MMKEITTRQIEGEPKRKWFSSRYFDLILYFDEHLEIIGIQLCYDKFRNERAFTWKKAHGFGHNLIDDGEGRPGKYKASPLLLSDGVFDKETIAAIFIEESSNMDPGMSDFVHKKIMGYETSAV
jgi:hypothetical protein